MANTNKKDKLNDIIGFDFGGPAPKNKAPKKKPAQKDNDDKVIKEIEIEDDIALDEDLENEEDFDDIYEFDPESVVSTKKSLSVIGGISGGALILFIALFFILKQPLFLEQTFPPRILSKDTMRPSPTSTLPRRATATS